MTPVPPRFAGRLDPSGGVLRPAPWWRLAPVGRLLDWILALTAAPQQRGQLRVPYFHSVGTDLPASFTYPAPQVWAPAFERFARVARHECEVVADPSEWHDAPPSARPRLWITFDDGYRDNYELAFPVLRRHALSATVFVTTGWLRDSDHAPGVCLSWREVREMAAAGIRFGAHTVSHPSLPELSEREAEAEIRESKRALEDRLGVPCTLFAYPFGHVDRRVRDLVAKAGFQWAVTTCEGVASLDGDPLLMPRTYLAASDLLYTDLRLKLRGLHEWRGPLWRTSRLRRAVYWRDPVR